MSETLSAESVATYESEIQASQPENHFAETADKNEIKDPTWGDALRELVAANADVMVRCPWMGGAEVTVSNAMTTFNYPPNLTAADEPYLISVVLDLLANRVEDTKEEEDETEEDQTDEEESNKDEPAKEKAVENKNDPKTQKVQDTPKAAELDKPAKDEAAQTKPSEPRASITEKNSALEANNSINEENFDPENHVLDKPDQHIQAAAEVEVAENFSNAPDNSVIETEPPTVTDIPPKSMNAAPVAVETDEIAPTFEIPKEHILDESDIKTADEILDSGIEVVDEATELNEELQENEPPDYEAEVFEISDFESEQEIPIGDLETDLELDDELLFGRHTIYVDEDFLDPAEIPVYQPDSETIFSRQTKMAAEKPVQVTAPIEEVEKSVVHLVDRIESAEPETIEIANEILDKIIEVPAKLDAGNDKEIITEVQAQEELEELFTELLEILDIEYNPELIESLARLTMQLRLADKVKEIKTGESTDETPSGYGTHEIIRQLLNGISDLKKTSQAGAIGQLTMLLYNFRIVSNT